MADNITLNSGSGGSTVKTDDDGTAHWQYVKIAYGADNTQTRVTTAAPLPVDLRTDNLSGNLDVNIAAQTSDVTIADGGNSITIDNSVLTNFHSADFDSGAGTDTTAAIGIAVPASGGAAIIPGDATAGLKVDLGADNDVTITGTVTVDNGGTFAVQAAQSGTWNVNNVSGTVSLPTGAATSANQSTANTSLSSIDTNTGAIVAAEGAALGSGVLLQGDDGTDRKNVNVDATTGDVQVDVTNTVTVDLGSNNDVTVTGGNAHDGTTLGNPVLGGARATNSVEGITQVANADLTHVQSDLNGVLISRPHTTLEEILSERISNTNGTSTNFTTFGAGGAGIHNYVTTISIYNSSATDGYVDFRDGSAGSIIFTAAAPATGGSVINFPVPLKGAANTALAYDVSGALSTVYISVVGFQAQG